MPLTLRLQSLLGLPVLQQNGKKAGEVKDVWLDEFWCLAGVALESRLWSGKRARLIHWQDIVYAGEDALLIRNGQSVVKMDKSRILRAFLGGIVRLKDKPVYTVNGLQLGRISDVYFKADSETTLIGFELTDGFLADVLEGRRRLMLPDGPEQIAIGEDAIMVPVSYERVLMKDQSRNAESDR